MNTIVVNITWEYFLGLIGTLIALAYYANGRFTRLETSVEWLTETFRGLKIASENSAAKLFETASPISLTQRGERILRLSGLKSYIDDHAEQLSKLLQGDHTSDLYEAQNRAFQLFATLKLDRSFERRLNAFAFSNGVSTDLLRRVGAIYFRDAAHASAQ